jgi:hypothetical protein
LNAGLKDGGCRGTAGRAAFPLAILAHPTGVAVALTGLAPGTALRFAVRVRARARGGGAALGALGAATTHAVLVHPDGIGITLPSSGPLGALAVTVRDALLEAVTSGARAANFAASVGTVLKHEAGIPMFGVLAVTSEVIKRRGTCILVVTSTPAGHHCFDVFAPSGIPTDGGVGGIRLHFLRPFEPLVAFFFFRALKARPLAAHSVVDAAVLATGGAPRTKVVGPFGALPATLVVGAGGVIFTLQFLLVPG